MGLHKPQNIANLDDILKEKTESDTEDTIQHLLSCIGEFGRKSAGKDDLKKLSRVQPYYPVIPVLNKHFLLAIYSQRFKGLVWLCSWFEVESAYRDKNNVYRVRLKINDRIVEVDYDTLYPKDIIKLSRYGLIINFEYAESLSRYIFRMIAKLEVKE